MREAALLGCAVPTGVGAIFNTARPMPGQSIAIFGAGGIGLCAVVGAVIAGCLPIIAVDIFDSKLKLARKIGATHCFNANKSNPVEEIKNICPGGIDFAIEASGLPSVMLQALHSVRNQGGTAVVIGNAHHGKRILLDPLEFNLGKRIFGTWGGDNQPDRDYARYTKLLSAGKLNIQPLISKTYALREINEAIDDLESGRAVRPVVDMSRI